MPGWCSSGHAGIFPFKASEVLSVKATLLLMHREVTPGQGEENSPQTGFSAVPGRNSSAMRKFR